MRNRTKRMLAHQRRHRQRNCHRNNSIAHLVAYAPIMGTIAQFLFQQEVSYLLRASKALRRNLTFPARSFICRAVVSLACTTPPRLYLYDSPRCGLFAFDHHRYFKFQRQALGRLKEAEHCARVTNRITRRHRFHELTARQQAKRPVSILCQPLSKTSHCQGSGRARSV